MSSLTGLVANYGDSDEEQDPARSAPVAPAALPAYPADAASAAIHPPPIPHCAWSACYDEGSGFTYYWNQQTNAVTWEAPPEYLLALKLAQQHLHTAGSTEVSAEEWQLYQQALAEKQNSQNKLAAKAAIFKPPPYTSREKEKSTDNREKKLLKYAKKRPASEDEDEKIELITSFYNSDSESNDESESPTKSSVPPKPQPPPAPKHVVKKQKKLPPVEYGPSLPPNQNYSVPIGPELPPNVIVCEPEKPVVKEEEKKPPRESENEDSQDESLLLMKLKDKAKLLAKLGGEIPSELQQIIKEGIHSGTVSPARSEGKKENIDTIDDLLEEIEKKELPKVKSKVKVDMFDEGVNSSKETSARNSPRSNGGSPPREEVKTLFPSSKAIVDEPEKPCLFPSAVNVEENGIEKARSHTPPIEKKTNMYLPDSNDIPTASRKKLRISNSVLPERKTEAPSYTTKYSTHIEGFSSERTGLGFSKEEDGETSPKTKISYGKGLMFTKGETLNEDKKDDDLDDLMELVEAKLKYLDQVQPCMVTPVQEMLIQMQALGAAFRSGALAGAWWARWVRGAGARLREHEARAVPPGWALLFHRPSARYRYERESDGFVQWEYPAPPADMDICTTPPPPPEVEKVEPLCVPPPPPPPPPAWRDPPPPGTDEPPPPLPPEPPQQEIGDELASFYSDIAALEQPPLPPAPPPPPALREDDKKEKAEKTKKKSKVKISSSIGMKHKSVSSLVAKWQQVAEEINSD